MSLLIKICGLASEEALDAAVSAGADMVGLVFFPPSPRHVSLDRAAQLAQRARGRAGIVVLTVDADDTLLADIVADISPDMLQLHGRETPERLGHVAQAFGRPVMKALGIGSRDDLAAIASYRPHAARILLDAKPPLDATRPGGNGEPFDWAVLADADIGPYFLSGGLDADNVARAVRLARPAGIDVSSGVESSPGVKDADAIAAFIHAAREAASDRRLAS